MRYVMVALGLALLLALVPAVGAQPGLPLLVSVKYIGGSTNTVTVSGTTVPGTVVSVKGATKVVDRTGKFSLKSPLPISLVAVKDKHIRRLTINLPSGATKWLSWLTVNANLTQMKTTVAGALTIKDHPSASVIVEHVEADKIVQAAVTQGKFSLGFPLVPRINTLNWTLRYGFLSWNAPRLTFTVQ
ncbi:MAG: hypothetical protein ACRDFA_10060 [bacterium]